MSKLKLIVLTISLLVLSGCGGGSSSSGVGGGDPAVGCAQTSQSGNNLTITNSCEDTINVLIDGQRFNIPPGETRTANIVSSIATLSACFAPSVPESDGGLTFTCS